MTVEHNIVHASHPPDCAGGLPSRAAAVHRWSSSVVPGELLAHRWARSPPTCKPALLVSNEGLMLAVERQRAMVFGEHHLARSGTPRWAPGSSVGKVGCRSDLLGVQTDKKLTRHPVTVSELLRPLLAHVPGTEAPAPGP